MDLIWREILCLFNSIIVRVRKVRIRTRLEVRIRLVIRIIRIVGRILRRGLNVSMKIKMAIRIIILIYRSLYHKWITSTIIKKLFRHLYPCNNLLQPQTSFSLKKSLQFKSMKITTAPVTQTQTPPKTIKDNFLNKNLLCFH